MRLFATLAVSICLLGLPGARGAAPEEVPIGAVLVIGGAPTVWNTIRKMLKGNFAADVVAMLAIVTAVIMREYFAGVIIVIMQTGGEALENYSLRRASSSLQQLLARAPRARSGACNVSQRSRGVTAR